MIILSLIIQTLLNLNQPPMATQSIFDIRIKMLDGTELDWSEYKGKKLLIVNVASECGYTPQYAQLQELYELHHHKLVVIGVPCNDFGGQEPGSADQIVSFCSSNYKVTFPMTAKVGIKKDAHPLYQWLMLRSNNGISDHEVVWNFHKFLINEDGTIHASLPSAVTPLDDQILSWIK